MYVVLILFHFPKLTPRLLLKKSMYYRYIITVFMNFYRAGIYCSINKLVVFFMPYFNKIRRKKIVRFKQIFQNYIKLI